MCGGNDNTLACPQIRNIFNEEFMRIKGELLIFAKSEFSYSLKFLVFSVEIVTISQSPLGAFKLNSKKTRGSLLSQNVSLNVTCKSSNFQTVRVEERFYCIDHFIIGTIHILLLNSMFIIRCKMLMHSPK